jgi:hypothetical protein
MGTSVDATMKMVFVARTKLTENSIPWNGKAKVSSFGRSNRFDKVTLVANWRRLEKEKKKKEKKKRKEIHVYVG